MGALMYGMALGTVALSAYLVYGAFWKDFAAKWHARWANTFFGGPLGLLNLRAFTWVYRVMACLVLAFSISMFVWLLIRSDALGA